MVKYVLLVMPRDEGISASGVSPKWVKSKRHKKKERRKKKRKKERKRGKQWPASLTSTTTNSARKPPGPILHQYDQEV